MDDKIQSEDFDGLMYPLEFGYETCENGYVIYASYGTALPPYTVTKLLNGAYKQIMESLVEKILKDMREDITNG